MRPNAPWGGSPPIFLPLEHPKSFPFSHLPNFPWFSMLCLLVSFICLLFFLYLSIYVSRYSFNHSLIYFIYLFVCVSIFWTSATTIAKQRPSHKCNEHLRKYVKIDGIHKTYHGINDNMCTPLQIYEQLWSDAQTIHVTKPLQIHEKDCNPYVSLYHHENLWKSLKGSSNQLEINETCW